MFKLKTQLRVDERFCLCVNMCMRRCERSTGCEVAVCLFLVLTHVRSRVRVRAVSLFPFLSLFPWLSFFLFAIVRVCAAESNE